MPWLPNLGDLVVVSLSDPSRQVVTLAHVREMRLQDDRLEAYVVSEHGWETWELITNLSPLDLHNQDHVERWLAS